MKTQNLIKTAIALIITLTLYSTNAAAQDKITFTWMYPIYTDGVALWATQGKTFIVDWGDGSAIETKIGAGAGESAKINLKHAYATAGEYMVIISAYDADCRFTKFRSPYCKLTTLSLAGCTALTDLNCSWNQLTELDVTGCTSLSIINCVDNRLHLSDLFAVQFVQERYLGIQYLYSQTVIIGEELFAEQSVFDGIFTEYDITREDAPSSPNDFYVVDGKLIFNTIGKYTVAMTNDAITSTSSSYKVIVPLDIGNVGIIENDESNIKVFPNPTRGELRITNYELRGKSLSEIEIQIFDVFGKNIDANLGVRLNDKKEIVIDMSCLPTGIYFLHIDGQTKKIIKE